MTVDRGLNLSSQGWRHASHAFWRLVLADSAVLAVFAAKSLGLERERLLAHIEHAWQSVQRGGVVQTRIVSITSDGAALAMSDFLKES